MLKNFIYRLLERRQYWRFVGFDQLSELYTSAMLRSMGLSLVGIFIPIYLYKLGYPLPDIFLFMAGMYGTRIVADFASGYLVAMFGPKRTMLCSYMMQIFSLLMLLSLPQFNWPLWQISVSWGLAYSLFFIAYHVSFSKMMNAEHGGKELGLMTILERFGGAIGPILGGVVASVFGAEYMIGAAVLLLVLAIFPLLLSDEPTKTKQKLYFTALPYRKLWRDFVSFSALGAEMQLSWAAWPLFLAISTLAINTYAGIGLVTAFGVVAAILAARFIGYMIDRKHGGELLRWSAAGNIVVSLFRPFVNSFAGAVLVNITRDSLATGFQMSLTKGMYARADDLPGMRIVYIVVMEMISEIGKMIPWLILWLLALSLSHVHAMTVALMLGGIFSLLVMTQRFPALQPRRIF